MQKYITISDQKSEFHNQNQYTQFSADEHKEEQAKYGSEGEGCR